MKNLPQRVRAKQRSKSSYARNKKAPYLYSEAYRAWRRSTRAKARPDNSIHG